MKKSTFKVIETHFDGYHFRSRLEARYAVFFNTLGIPYEYEKEGYVLSDGTYYLPDFWLPELKRWVEIKGQEPTTDELAKMYNLHYGTGYPTVILHGLPGENEGHSYITCAHQSGNGGLSESSEVEWRECPTCGCIDVNIRCYDGCMLYSQEDVEDDLWSCNCNYGKHEGNNTPRLIAAYTAARSARF